MSTIEEEMAKDDKSGGLWGSIRNGQDILAMLQQGRIRTAELGNELYIEVTRDDGGVGVYRLPIAEAIDTFP